MISINNLTVSFGSWELFSGINFHISESDKISLAKMAQEKVRS